MSFRWGWLDLEVIPLRDPMISPAELAALQASARVKVLDGSWYLDGRSGVDLFLQAHIAGARFFDIEAISDRSADLPHMLPSPQDFARAAGELGLERDDAIVVYDQQGLFSAARVWWSLRTMGCEDVRVLDGGLPAWRAQGRPVEAGPSTGPQTVFHPAFQAERVASIAVVRQALSEGSTVIDARPAARFRGEAPEPRAGLRGGHMPGAKNLPALELIDAQGRLKSREALKSLFDKAGVDIEGPVITSCGSGVTACILALGLARLGKQASVYDGSWAEWGAPSSGAPVATGA